MRGSASLGESRLGNRRVVFGTRIDPIFLGVAVIFFTIVSLLSLVAGIAVWPVVLRMRYLESVLGEICASLNVAGVVSMAVLAAISLAFMLWQHVQFSIYVYTKPLVSICYCSGSLSRWCCLRGSRRSMP